MSALILSQNRRRSSYVLRLLELLHDWISSRQAVAELNALSDATLADVGLERTDIAARVDCEMGRIGRLGLGR